MTFNIGSQSGGVINNVAGDQNITGQQYGTLVTTEDARRALGDLRQRGDDGRPRRATAAAAHAQVAEMDETLRAERPDKPRFAGALERLTRLLSAAGRWPPRVRRSSAHCTPWPAGWAPSAAPSSPCCPRWPDPAVLHAPAEVAAEATLAGRLSAAEAG